MMAELEGMFAARQQTMMEDMVRRLGQPHQTATNEVNAKVSIAQDSNQPVDSVGSSSVNSRRSGRSLGRRAQPITQPSRGPTNRFGSRPVDRFGTEQILIIDYKGQRSVRYHPLVLDLKPMVVIIGTLVVEIEKGRGSS